MFIHPNALNSLEIKEITKFASQFCRCELGFFVSENTRPAENLSDLKERLALFSSYINFIDKNGDLPWSPKIVPIYHMIDSAKSCGILSGQELIFVRILMSLADRLKYTLMEFLDEYPQFKILTEQLRDFSSELEQLSVIDEDGYLYDSASEYLSNTRMNIRNIRDKIRARANTIFNDKQISPLLTERVLSQRYGKFVCLVRADARTTFPGTLIEVAPRGNSVYMAPHVLDNLNAQYNSLCAEEKNESDRILTAITTNLIARLGAINSAENVIGTLDLFFSLAEIIRKYKWHIPHIATKTYVNLKEARHPLLPQNSVPINICCGEDFSSLVITGPNTGGKTVALKTVGVCTILTWFGWPIPASDDSTIGDIDAIFTDIGDEQSIEQSLSTFSAHIKQIKEIDEAATGKSLILLDELGAGTDPEEGAALGIAMLENFLERGSLVISSTHHNPIKYFAITHKGVEAASVEFDAKTLCPTYKILIGVPGQSNAITIASVLGLSQKIIARAKNAMQGEANTQEMISELIQKTEALELKQRKTESLFQKATEQKEKYDKKLKNLTDNEFEIVNSAKEKANEILRSTQNEAKNFIKKIRNSHDLKDAQRILEKKNKSVKERATSHTRSIEDKLKKESVAVTGETLQTGDTVMILSLGTKAIIQEVNNKEATVTSKNGNVTISHVKLSNLKLVASTKEKKPEKNVTIFIERPTNVPMELDLHEMDRATALPELEQYLDRAYRAGYGSVRIIHGHGKGVMRQAVHDVCAATSFVKSFALAGISDGGYGATIVIFKRG
ncbi:MAG: Smr/MutS family protein [Synergistaceae bacterium]|nr:Smr/MutS family protein [Synergistaceae bacterium]